MSIFRTGTCGHVALPISDPKRPHAFDVHPLTGYTNFIRDYLTQAKTLEEKPAELLDDELVPFVQRSKNRDAHVVYFHSIENPFEGITDPP